MGRNAKTSEKKAANSPNINNQSNPTEYTAKFIRLQLLLAEQPNNLILQLQLGDLYNQYHKHGEAIACFESIKKRIIPNSKSAVDFLYGLYFKLSVAYKLSTPPQINKAIENLQNRLTLIKNNPHVEPAYSLLLDVNANKDIGNIFMESSQYENAISYFNHALSTLYSVKISQIYLGINEKNLFTSQYQPMIIETLEQRAQAHFLLGDYNKELSAKQAILTECLNDRDQFSEKLSDLYVDLGRICKRLDEKTEAIQYFQKAIDETVYGSGLAPQVLAEIFFEYALDNQTKGEYDKSIENAKSALTFQERNSINIGVTHRILSICYLSKNNAIEALHHASMALLLAEPNKNDDHFEFAESSTLLGQAHILNNNPNEAIIHFRNAVEFYQKSHLSIKLSNPELSKNVHIKMLEISEDLADVFMNQNNIKQAKDFYKLIVNKGAEKTADLYLKYGMCLQTLNELDKAIPQFRTALKIYEQNNDTKIAHCTLVFTRLAIIYYEKKQYNEAKINFKNALLRLDQDDGKEKTFPCKGYNIELNKNREIAFISSYLAAIFAQEGKNQEALSHYERALDDTKFQIPRHYRAYALCLMASDRPLEAILAYEKSLDNSGIYPDCDSDKKIASYNLAKLYFEQRNLIKAKENFFISQAYNASETTSQLPSELDLSIYEYLGDISVIEKDFDQATYYFNRSLEQRTAETSERRYKLGCAFYNQRKCIEADHQFKLALQHPNNDFNTERAQMALEESYARKRERFDSKKSLDIQLPEAIKTILEQLLFLYPQAYIGGSTIHSLLKNTPLTNNQDLDFLVIGEASNRLNEELKFDTSRFNSNLYTKKENGFSVDCFVKRLQDNTNPLLSDFTITSIYCDHNGKLYDKSKRGIDDFYARRLNTVNPSATMVFQNDPTSLLRAIKYIIRDFKPSPTFEQAMLAYTQTPLTPNKQQHLCAIMRGMLKSFPTPLIIAQLKRYQLIEKLFGISNQLKHDETLYQLNTMITQHSPLRSPTRLSQSRASFHYVSNLSENRPSQSTNSSKTIPPIG